MKPNITWTMSVAVISGWHRPNNDHDNVPDNLTFRDADGSVIVYIEDLIEPDLTDKQKWLLPVAALLYPEFNWVRFDPDADVIEGLPTFKWD